MSTPCVKIKWTDPPDILTNEPVPATWAGTVVVRKEGSAPRHKWDGTLIVDSTTRDEYAVNALEDDQLESNKEYYYGIFPYDTDGDVRFTKVEKVSVGEIYHEPTTWIAKSWNGLSSFDGLDIWADGDTIYYSYSQNQYVLDKATDTWNVKTWNGMTKFSRQGVWTDGENIYHCAAISSSYRVLDKSTSTWNPKSWNWDRTYPSLYGNDIWTDGENYYFSSGTLMYSQCILNKNTSTWSPKTWPNYQPDRGQNVWTDGENIYYSNQSEQYKLNKSSGIWEPKTWYGFDAFTSFNSHALWTDGENIYFSKDEYQYVLDKSTSTWMPKTWEGNLYPRYGQYVWNDGEHIYYSEGSAQYVLQK